MLHLPVGSAFNAMRRGGLEFRDWDATRYALVDSANTLRALQHLYLCSHIDRKKHSVPKAPPPFPTPQEKRNKQITSKTAKPGTFMHMVLQAKVAHIAEKKKRR